MRIFSALRWNKNKNNPCFPLRLYPPHTTLTRCTRTHFKRTVHAIFISNLGSYLWGVKFGKLLSKSRLQISKMLLLAINLQKLAYLPTCFYLFCFFIISQLEVLTGKRLGCLKKSVKPLLKSYKNIAIWERCSSTLIKLSVFSSRSVYSYIVYIYRSVRPKKVKCVQGKLLKFYVHCDCDRNTNLLQIWKRQNGIKKITVIAVSQEFLETSKD